MTMIIYYLDTSVWGRRGCIPRDSQLDNKDFSGVCIEGVYSGSEIKAGIDAGIGGSRIIDGIYDCGS